METEKDLTVNNPALIPLPRTTYSEAPGCFKMLHFFEGLSVWPQTFLKQMQGGQAKSGVARSGSALEWLGLPHLHPSKEGERLGFFSPPLLGVIGELGCKASLYLATFVSCCIQ